MKTDDKRAAAIERVARETLSIELRMEHKESERTLSLVELRKALEAAYDAGRRSALS